MAPPPLAPEPEPPATPTPTSVIKDRFVILKPEERLLITPQVCEKGTGKELSFSEITTELGEYLAKELAKPGEVRDVVLPAMGLLCSRGLPKLLSPPEALAVTALPEIAKFNFLSAMLGFGLCMLLQSKGLLLKASIEQVDPEKMETYGRLQMAQEAIQLGALSGVDPKATLAAAIKAGLVTLEQAEEWISNKGVMDKVKELLSAVRDKE